MNTSSGTIRLILILSFLSTGPLVVAETLSRDEAIRLAYQNNRELAIATLEISRAASRLRWSGRLENPEFEISRSGDGFGKDDDESVHEIGFTQKFPLTAKLKHEKNLRRYQVILAEAEIAEQHRELAGRVDLALVNLVATREKMAVSRELVQLNLEIVNFLKKQAKEGLVSSLDVMQATLNGRTLEQQSKSLEALEKQNLLDLVEVIGLDADTPVQAGTRFTVPGRKPGINISLDTVLRQRPDYVLALAKTDEAAAAVTLEEAKRWQDVSLRLFVEQEEAIDEPLGREGNTFTGFGISIPLPLRNRNQEGIELARINEEAAEKGVDAVRFRIRSECEEAFHRRSDSWELARDASGEILDLAETNLEEFRKAYQQGQASLIQVQRAQEQVLELKTASLEFVAEYERAAAQVRLATGAYPGLTTSSK
ncbi:MAG: TolC family protein [Verrucomicrobiales bacterium]|nr:TolC family protein [Verrucomicrobiales bacterium]